MTGALVDLFSTFYIFACRFILENWVLDRWVRNILTVYPVVIVALVGNIWKHYKPADPSANSVFMGEFFSYFLKVMLVLKVFDVLIGFCPLSGAVSVGLYPAVVQSLYCDLEELQATSSLPRLSSAHDFTS